MAKDAAGAKRKPKAKPKPKLSDEERHKRFVAVAREVDVDERPEAFDSAFHRVAGRVRAKQPTQP